MRLGVGGLRPIARDLAAPNLGAGTAKDPGIRADSEVVKDKNMLIRPAANISDFDDAATARWLREKLEPARLHVGTAPTADAIDRIRARVFGEPGFRRSRRSIAA